MDVAFAHEKIVFVVDKAEHIWHISILKMQIISLEVVISGVQPR